MTINWPLITVDLGQPQYIDPDNPEVAPVIVGGNMQNLKIIYIERM